MNTVDPIRNPKKILAIKNNLKGREEHRNYLLFSIGVNSALRSSDLRNLKVSDVLGSKGDIKKFCFICRKFR